MAVKQPSTAVEQSGVEKKTYIVMQGHHWGVKKQYEAGDEILLTEIEAAPFVDKVIQDSGKAAIIEADGMDAEVKRLEAMLNAAKTRQAAISKKVSK